MAGVIYLVTNTKNSKRYVGKTKNSANSRLKEHFSSARCGVGTVFCKAIRKYGEESFVVTILEEAPLECLKEREAHYIASLKPEYNMTGGGEGCQEMSQEVKNKISKANTGKIRTPEERARISTATKAGMKKMSEESRAKMKTPISDETKARISLSNKGRELSNTTKLKMSARMSLYWAKKRLAKASLLFLS
jgi:group I intron endonuclease